MSVIIPIIDSPMQLSSNFVLSCESNDINTYSVGDSVTTWIGNVAGNNLIEGYAGKAGKFFIDGDGFKCVKFTRSNSETNKSSISFDQPSELTYCVVFSLNSIPSSNVVVISKFNNTPRREPVTLFFSTNPSNVYINPFSPPYNTPTFIFSTGVKYLLVYTRDANNVCTIRINNVIIGQTTITGTLSKLSSPYGIASNSESGLNGNLNDANYYQVHVAHEVLSDEKLKKLTRYCAFKSGMKI